MPDSSIFLSGSDINTYVGAWVPVSSRTLRREGSQVGSHAHFAPTFTFQARIMPEGLTMVRMPWDEELQEAPQPLSTWYKLPRPTCCPNSTCTPSVGLYGLHWEGGPLGPAKPRGHTPFSIFALSITLRGILSLLSCGFAFPAFISSPLFPDGRFPLPAVGLRDRRASRRSCSLSSCSLPQRNWRCWSDVEFDHQKIHPRLVKSPHLWDQMLHPGSRSLQLKISLRTGKETTPP